MSEPEQLMDRHTFLASLPRKRVGTGALIRDEDGRVCLVEPTYRELWLLPGGTVEADESPYAGCVREVREELGLQLSIGRLLCTDWVAAGSDPSDNIVFGYDGGILSPDQIALISVPPEELRSFRFVRSADLSQYLSERNQRRIVAALTALESGSMIEIGDDRFN